MSETTHAAASEKPLMAHGSVLQLGVHNGKIGMWLFLASEVMFFTGLIGAYIVLRAQQITWANPSESLNVPLTAANTFLLICSSVTLVWGLQAIQAGDRRTGNIGLLLTTLFGAIFVGVQAFEYYELIYHRGMVPSSDLFASCFYTMTGFHGFHVLVGVIAMGVITVMGFMGKFGPEYENHAIVELTGLYWHFVDLVWIILFAIVYLM
ncbi:MAG: cytochrome c oxidase subunit 3 [Phycisphaeraceae bacterium]|nr:cytochrome c oxidase subunit 3 [Phycisphaeraceae bacterium]